MQHQFRLLAQLQRLDDVLAALQREQHDLPQMLQPYAQACTKARATLAQLHDTIEHTERQRRTLERQLEGVQAQLMKTQHKLREVKTNKEYSAVLVEVDTHKQHIAALEDQVLELMEMSEQQRQGCRVQEQHVQEAIQGLAQQEKHVEQTRVGLTQQIATEAAKRRDLVTELDEAFYTVYQRIVSQRGGQAVVLVQNGTCNGCYLKVQPQLVSEIRQQEKLITCPHCKRIMLWPTEE